jgi:hypothetical protein
MRYGLIVAIVGALLALAVMPVHGEEGTQSSLTAVAGAGKGRAIVSPTAKESDGLYAQVEIEIEGAPSNTTMSVTRALFTDGTCSIVTKPWAQVGSFITGADGAGDVHFVRDTTNPVGSTFYTMFRIIGGGAVLQSDCITVFVK